MSVTSEIARIKNNIAAVYDEAEAKGATMPAAENSANLAETVASIPTGIPVDTTSYNQANTQARSFVSEVTYDPTDYTYSELSTYVVATAYDKGKPFGVTITVPEAGTLTLTDGSRSMSYSVSAGSHTIYNITPGNTGAYVVKNSSDNIVAAGLLKPTDSLRMINGSATYNIRDLGGWSCDGGTVRYGRLFRGGEINSADASLFHDLLGIRAELNLRWDDEVSGDTSLIGSDVDFKHISGPWYTTGTGENWLTDAHKQILNYCMDQAIAGVPLYFHCSAGADRTGTIAFLLESMLGMSQSDTDKDYELTSFYTGIDTDAAARRRDENAWKNYMAEFSSYTGNNMRDKVVNWALTIGITIEKINAFRQAMIDGTPATLSGDVGSATVTRAITGASSDNTANTNAMYQPYTAKITPDDGKVITAVQITMGGTDITKNVFSGNETTFNYSVSFNLSNCSLATLPQRKAVVSGECFCCTLEADTGYTLADKDNPTVSITMGGTNVSTYYKDGVINIPRVTGNLVINVTAAASAPAYTNQILESTSEIGGSTKYNNGLGYKNNYRYNSSMAESAENGSFITGYIKVSPGDVLYFYGNVISGTSAALNSAVYKDDGTKVTQLVPSNFYGNNGQPTNVITNHFDNINYDSTNKILKSMRWKKDFDGYIHFSLVGNYTAGVTVITINEEID